jgi:hypothetical protein
MTITFLDIVQFPASYLKYDVSEIVFCLRLHVETTKVDQIEKN